MPPAAIDAKAELAGNSARIDARVAAGGSHISLVGRAPLNISGALDLRAGGAIDLGLLDRILAAGGRRIRGQLTFDGNITGKVAAPNVTGSARLSGGEVQDYASGLHLRDIVAQVTGTGTALRITQMTAKAGQGTITATGSIAIAAPGVPLDLSIQARNAQPLANDMITAIIDADVALHGEALGQLAASGSVHVQRAELRIPDRMPASIAVLPVRQPGNPSATPPAAAPAVALDVMLTAPGHIFLRGRGVGAEFGGAVRLGGTTVAPRTAGGLDLRRGSISLAGRSLDFTEGRIGFTGGSITDPALHLVATSTSGGVSATLTIGGTAQEPMIALSSVPALPQDEVLAHLLFGSGVGRLGVFEVAQIATGLATLTGAGGIGDPLDKVRQGLGLDRLAVGNGASGSPTLEAGRYIAPRVYLGAKQTASGGTQANVQVDITKGLKLEATAGTGSGSATGTTGTSDGSSIGLTYQLEY
jgi:translocation and assembly module TamB